MLGILGGHEGVGITLLAGTACTTDAVNVILGIRREIVVDDPHALLDIQATCSDIGGDHDGAPTRLEVGQDHVTLTLVLVPMDGSSAIPAHVALQLVAHSLSGAEDDDARALAMLLQDGLDVTVLLVHAIDHVHVLRDVLVGLQLVRADVDLHRVLHEVGSQLPHFLGPSGSEEHGLPLRRDMLQDFANLGFEPHVQHPVGLVHHQILHLPQADGTHFEEIVQSAWGCDCDVDPRADVVELGPFRGTPIQASAGHAGGAPELGTFGLNLCGQLARWGEHKRGRASPGIRAFRVDVIESRHEEGQCLA